MILHILHLSDLHARPERDPDIRIVLTALHQRLTATLSQTGWQIDLVCFTGDLANKGAVREYEFAQNIFLDPLLALLRLDKTRIFLSPGNHDVQRALYGPDLDYENELLSTLTSRDAVNRLLDTPTERARAFSRLSAYKSFTGMYLPCLPPTEDPIYACVRTVQIGDADLAIASLNSAWRCNSDQDFKRLLIGERQVDCAAAKTRHAGLRISLVHHPFTWLSDFDERDCGRRSLAESDLILSGHIHDPLPMVNETPLGRCLFSSAGALFDGRKFNGFSIIEIDTETFEGAVFLFRYYDDRRAFDRDLFIVEDGIFRFDLARSSTAARRMQPTHEERPDEAAVILDEAKKRERVTQAFKGLQNRRGGPWLLGVALGLVDHGPPRDGAGQLEPVNLTGISTTDEAIARLLRDLVNVGYVLRETDAGVSTVTARLVQLLDTATELWPDEAQQRIFAQFDDVVEALIQADMSAQDILPAKLLAVDELLQEQQYELALKQLRALNTYNPLVRAKLVEALHTTGKHSEVIAIVSSAPPGTLEDKEIEHCIWSCCEVGDFALAAEWLEQHALFHTTSARLFRRAVSDRFPDLARMSAGPRGDA